ncbi:MAG: PD40 domain-containing protein [Desulfovibrio sp.]|jgi:TolB protein|nr:PD40 domain-containing protein [Desulfovibrio sp.]
MKLKTWILTCLMLLVLAKGAQADALSVDIFGPGQNKVNILVLPARGPGGPGTSALAKSFAENVQSDITYLPFLRLAYMNEILGGDPSRGLKADDIDFKPLQLGRIDLVMTVGGQGQEIEARVYETYTRKLLVGKSYSQVTEGGVPLVADRFAAQLMRVLTGKSGFFDSTLAFSKRVNGGKELFTASALGRGLTQITADGGFNVSPSWSKDGRFVAYTNISDKGHRLGIWDRGRKVSRLRKFAGNVAISPTYTPDGRIAISLSLNGHPDIYLLDADLNPGPALAPSWAIGVSPAFDLSGRKMVFCSGRLGGPQIFMLNRDTGAVERITYEGSYNTRPSLSPDGRFVVFARLTSDGHRIFIRDLVANQERQISFGPGNDEDPSFDPDGYFVSFASSRNGGSKIFVTTRYGDPAKQIPTGPGDAMAPAWGVAPALE